MTTKKTTAKKTTSQKKNSSGIKPVTYVAVLLDTSGSMGGIREATVKSFNDQIATYRNYAKEQTIYSTLVKFSSQSETLFFNVDANQLKDLELHDYRPNGNTAMYDAIADTLDRLVYETKDNDNTSYLVTIISDGEENGSQRYSGEEGRQRVHAKIKALEEKGNWTFTFIGANQDIREASAKLGISASNALRFNNTSVGVGNMSNVHASGLNDYFGARSAGVMSCSNFYAGSEDAGDKVEISQENKDAIEGLKTLKRSLTSNNLITKTK